MKSLVMLLLMLVPSPTIAQTDGSVSGTVLDMESTKGLAGANVVLKNTMLGTVAGPEGAFRIASVIPGHHELRVSHVGYQSVLLAIDVEGGKETVLRVLLAPAIIPAQPITVTATRAKERETPATFETLERQQIRERYTTQDIPVLLAELPSSTYYSESGSGIGYTYLNIRGFDARRVAVMVNGIPQNDPEDHNVYWLDIPDIAASLEDIQVQRGAGSAFYGPPAIGGSVNLVTSSFGRERSLQLSAGVGSYNTRKYSASYTTGLFDDRYALHGSLSKILSSGYRDRAWVDFSSYFLGLARYDENMTTQINFYGGPIADGLAYYGIPKAYVKGGISGGLNRRFNPIQRPEEIENFSQPHYELLHEWRLTPSLTLNNTMFVVLGEGFFDYDGSWAPYSYFRITRENGFNIAGDPDTLFLPGALIRAQVTNRQYGWLPRLTIKHPAGELIVGGELRNHRSLHWGRVQWAQELPPDVPLDYRYYEYKGAKDIASVYAHELYSVTSDLKLMLDLQYAYNRYRLYDEKFLGTDFALPYHFLNPHAGLNWNIDDHWNSYVNLAYTSREPRLKNLYDAAEASTPGVVPQFAPDQNGKLDFGQPLVKPESLFDIELGGGFTDGDSRLSANLYWMEFSDEIVKSGRIDRFGQPVTGNAGRTRHLGLELSGRGAFPKGFELSANLTLSRNRFVRNTDYSKGYAVSLHNNPIAGFPDVLGNVRLTFRVHDVALSWSARYVGKQFTDNFKDEQNTVDPFVVSDAWVSYDLKDVFNGVNIEAKLQVNNLFNELYAAYGEGNEFFVGAERNMFFNLAIAL